MECNNLPSRKMSGDNIASCVESVAKVLITTVCVAGVVYVAHKIDPNQLFLKWKDAEFKMTRI